jgi:uncharacterized protein YdeI (YjbR/CyaY-like superfamily)
MADELPVKAFRDEKAWESWLERDHERAAGIWVKFAKKGRGIPTVTYAEALDVALCYGWIDGLTRSLDEDYYVQRFTPRRPKSKWSQVNTAKAEALIASGRMKPAGLRQVEAAKADGRWAAAYPPASKLTVPEDLQAELERYPNAKEFFAGLDRQNRTAVLYQLLDAKRPETRARRIAKFVAQMNEGRKPLG